MSKLSSNRIERLIGGLFFICLVAFSGAPTFAQDQPNLAKIFKESKLRRGKSPIVIVPGIMGSELIHRDTGERLWFSLSRSKIEDLRLPVATTLALSRDALVSGDIIREVNLDFFPDVRVYRDIIETLTKYGGYEEASWSDPPENIEDKFFVFPYDWRRDNVETAQYLIEELAEIKRVTKSPNTKFNVLAHSMGGLIARYAAMYGTRDLKDAGRFRPKWEGEKDISSIFFLGTPNNGAAGAFRTLLRGVSSLGGQRNLPFVRYLSPVDVATMPSVFQLLPNTKSELFLDENLLPLKIDIYNAKNWRKYKWAIYDNNKDFAAMNEIESERFEQYFSIVLKRAKRFQAAINSPSAKSTSIKMFMIGSDCFDTLDRIVLYQNPENGRWVTMTRARKFRNSKGDRISSRRLKELMYSPGDGNVTRRSLLAMSAHKNKGISSLPIQSSFFACAVHDKITNNREIQNNLLAILLSENR